MGYWSTVKTGAASFGRDFGREAENAGILIQHGWKKVKSGVGRARDGMYGSTAMTAVGVQQAEMADARRGTLYFLAHTRVRPTPVSFGAFARTVFGDFGVNVSAFEGLAKDAVKATVGEITSTQDMATKPPEPREGLQVTNALVQQIRNALQPVLNRIVGYWQGFLDHARLSVRGLSDFLSFVTSTLVGTLASSIAGACPGLGYANDAVGMISGIVRATRNWLALHKLNKAGEAVELLEGPPKMMLKALQRHYVTRAVGGMWQTARSAGTTAIRATADGGGFGTGAIVGLVIAVLNRIASLIDRTAEFFLLKHFLNRARREWKAGARHPSQSELMSSHEAFGRWFRGALAVSPVLAALVLQSGVAAHPMRFAQLSNATGTMMSDAATYVDVLKRHSAAYLNQHKDEYALEFSGTDPFTEARVRMAYFTKLPTIDYRI